MRPTPPAVDGDGIPRFSPLTTRTRSPVPRATSAGTSSSRRSSSRKAGARSGRRYQSELAEQLGLIEVEMFRGHLVAANLITRHPAEVDLPSRRGDIARRRAHDTGVRASEPAL